MIASCINERRWPYSLFASVLTRNWLGGKDSNLRYRIQSPGPYHLATAHPELPPEEFTHNRPHKTLRSTVSKSCLARALGNDLVVFRDYFVLDHLASFVVDRMSD